MVAWIDQAFMLLHILVDWDMNKDYLIEYRQLEQSIGIGPKDLRELVSHYELDPFIWIFKVSDIGICYIGKNDSKRWIVVLVS